MISANKAFIKVFIVLLTVIVGICISAFVTVKQSQASERGSKQQAIVQAEHDTVIKSRLARNLQYGVNMLTPGNKQFNPRFLKKVLTKAKHRSQ
ncbi:hypothetical protein tinsulaeT_06600 [Thalassotalea insulae]|uniref:Uncharacterized protein n=2 Tax=Thalassotalea insulae TaxID=2056778 RepID=A0ABQ6GSB2_9GAMM|nr:hypothetical protein tinsulaeT_06600 [Thalassotalea insulae]